MNGKKFADVTVSARVGNIQKGHAVSFADLNNNGDLDIFVDYGGAYRGDYYHSALYLNPGQSDNNWISIQLEGTKSNRSAIGAKITLKVSDNAGKRTIYREMNSGASFGCSPLRAQIGIGKAQIIEEITVQWPSGINTIKLNNIQPNQMIRIKEGVEGFMEIPLKNIVFKKLDGSIPMCAPLKGALNE